MKDLVLPRKINASTPETFGRTAEEHSSDTFNMLLKVRERLGQLTADLDALEIDAIKNFGVPISTGGGNTEGVSPDAARADHDHMFRETSGPTDLRMGDVPLGDSIRRVADVLVGRQVEVRRLTTGPAVSNVAPLADVGSQLTFALKASADYAVAWLVFYQTALTTTGLQLAMNYTGTINQLRYGLFGATGATAMQSAVAGANDSPLGAVGVGPGGTDRVAVLYGFLRTTTAGSLALRFASGVPGSGVTIQNLSHGFLLQQ